MRNALGQEIKVGSPVVLIAQGQGWVNIGVGKVTSLKKVPVVTYFDGQRSSGVQRYERLLVLSEAEYAEHERRYDLFREIEENYYKFVHLDPRNQWWQSSYRKGWNTTKELREFMDFELRNRGEEPWYS